MTERIAAALAAMLVLTAAASASPVRRGDGATRGAAATAPTKDAEQLRAEIRVLEAELAALETGRADERGGQGFWQRLGEKLTRLLPITALGWVWFVVGFGGEFIFFLRFVVQWIASERRKRTVVPLAFWHLSLVGTGLVLAYALYRIDPVFILAYSLNVFIYVRNLVIARRNPAMEAIAEKTSE